MTTDTIRHLGAEFHHAADGVGGALRRLEHARVERLAFLRRCSKDSTARLATLKEEIRTLPEQIAKWDAEAARLESQTAEDLLRQALETKGGDPHAPDAESRGQVTPPSVGKAEGEPYRAGLPPERLRKVWAEWEGEHGTRVRFSGERGENYEYDKYPGHAAPADAVVWTGKYRPHGKTWAEVEAMADEAEQPTTPPAPTLLDLTKLPPGTVCEALDDIPRWNGRTVAAGVPFTLRDASTAEGDEFPMVVTTNGENSYCIPYVVPARVVKEGGEQ